MVLSLSMGDGLSQLHLPMPLFLAFLYLQDLLHQHLLAMP
jgi:hypothetical protein